MKLPPWLRRDAAVDMPPAAAPELIEPTTEEAANGWTAESLTEYVAERRKAGTELALRMFDRRQHRPRWANSKYSPHKWRAAR